MNTLPTVYVPRGAGPLVGLVRGLGALPVLPGAMGRRLGLGAVDLTNAALLAAGQTLHDALIASGCVNGFDTNTQAFQQAWINAGGTLPNDSGGRSPIDGYYGANTAAALAQMFPDAPAGCVGTSVPNPAGGAAIPTGLTTAPALGTNPIAIWAAGVLGGDPGSLLTLGLVAIGAVAIVNMVHPTAFNMYPGASKRGAARASKGRSAKKGKRKSKSKSKGKSRGKRSKTRR
jgi:hypothetical protein